MLASSARLDSARSVIERARARLYGSFDKQAELEPMHGGSARIGSQAKYIYVLGSTLRALHNNDVPVAFWFHLRINVAKEEYRKNHSCKSSQGLKTSLNVVQGLKSVGNNFGQQK